MTRWLVLLMVAAALAGTSLTAYAESAMVRVATNAQAGTILTDGAGRTLYMFAIDEVGKSNCSGTCLNFWPPLLSSDPPVAGPGVAAARLETITRSDGAKQVTYYGYPLYYFAGDRNLGDTNGQNVNGSGGKWYVMTAYGAPRYTQSEVQLGNSAVYGSFLRSDRGYTLYYAPVDGAYTPNCSGATLAGWPPLLTIAPPRAGAGVSGSLLGTVKQQDGSTQVTYNGWPLYYFRNDLKPNDITGQGGGGGGAFGLGALGFGATLGGLLTAAGYWLRRRPE